MSAIGRERLPRSLLFAPGVRPELMDKAHRSGADALIFDLEDSVPPDAKGEARRHVAHALQREDGLPVYVRLNHAGGDECTADLTALEQGVPTGLLQGVILPKVECAADIAAVDTGLSRIEHRTGWRVGSLAIVPMIESCLGLRNAFEIASSSTRVTGMVLASAEQGDLIVDLGGRWTPEARALIYPRSKLVCEARAAGVPWLIDGVFMNLKDNEALRRESAMARELGYVAKMAVHPAQLDAIHEAFSPTAEEIDYARGLVEAFREAESTGRGAIRYRGMMVDYANVKLAERVLAQGLRPRD